MDKLIAINFEGENPTVSGRELHAALKVETRYNDWFARMCEYGFSEPKDFYSILSKSEGGRPGTDHVVTVAMAKELCMLQRSEMGKKFREYFIAVEKDWNDPEKVIARSLRMATNGTSSQNRAINAYVDAMVEEKIGRHMAALQSSVTNAVVAAAEIVAGKKTRKTLLISKKTFVYPPVLLRRNCLKVETYPPEFKAEINALLDRYDAEAGITYGYIARFCAANNYPTSEKAVINYDRARTKYGVAAQPSLV